MMESASVLEQAISTFLSTFREVRRLKEFIEDLPTIYEMSKVDKSFLSNSLLKARNVTYENIENLFDRLSDSSLAEDINTGLTFGMPENDELSRRLKYLKYSLKREGIFQIEDIGDAYGVYGVEKSTSRLLSAVMDYTVAYDYADIVCGIYREWNLIVDCLGRVIEEIEDEFLNPQPESPKEQEKKTIRQSSILENPDIKEIFDEAVKRGFMEYLDEGIKWLRSNPLLAYFCQKLSVYLDLSEKLYQEKDGTNWSYFGGIFLTKRQGGNWGLANSSKLHDYKYGNMKGKTEFQPKGYEEIDELILDFT